ncbi:MAG: hypothetical protein ACJ8EY_09000 [Sphingomicrobium sp.]
MTRRPLAWILAALVAVGATGSAIAQQPEPVIQSPNEAIAQDAALYAATYSVSAEEAARRLRAQQVSAAATDAIRAEFRTRLAGISVQHRHDYRIVVLLTGAEPVAERMIDADGSQVPVTFRVGAKSTRDDVVTAIVRFGPTLRSRVPNTRGMGLDQRSGELVLLVTHAAADRLGMAEIDAMAEKLTGVPVSVRLAEAKAENASVAGGGRILGISPVDGKRYACTTGFNVTDAARNAVATAAHCPDSVTYVDADGQNLPLPFVGQWGTRYQDVQINLSDRPLDPLFYADRRSGSLRAVTSWRNRPSLRGGEFVCHYGESSGYSCAEIQLTDYAPPMELCGGQCDPMWLTVDGPNCRAGDSGGPVFAGTVAIGIFKGGSGTRSPRCNFYYFMSTDFLPPGWTLLYDQQARFGPRSRN